MHPTLASSIVTLPFTAPQGITDTGFVLEFDLANSLQASPATISPSLALRVSHNARGVWIAWETASPPADFEDQLGEVTNVHAGISPDEMAEDHNFFTMRTALGDFVFTEDGFTGDGASFLGYDNCPAADFSCLGVGQTVEVDSILGLATQIRFVASPQEPGAVVRGVIIATDNATRFEMVVLDEAPDLTGVAIGDRAQINLLTADGSFFGVDANSLLVSGLSFSGAADLLPGQTVQVEVEVHGVAATPPVIDTSRVILKQGSFTARVNTTLNATDFTVDTLPAVHMNGDLRVEASAASFEQVSNVAGLNVGDTVSVRGLLFKTGGTPVLVAGKVRKR